MAGTRVVCPREMGPWRRSREPHGEGPEKLARLLLTVVSLILILLPPPAWAQQVGPGAGPVVRGVVSAQESGSPLATGSVTLYRSDGTDVLTVITDDQGRYSLRAPAPGVYRLRAQRLGYHPQEKGPFTLRASDTLAVDFQLSPAPLLLDSILVSVRRRSQPLRPGEQFVYGRLLDDENSQPIPQGLVRLMGTSGSTAATTLSDDDGVFWLVSPSAGTYRLQAERIGYKTSTGPELHLMPGDTIALDFYLSMEAVLLNPIVVRATARPLGARYDLTGMEGFLRRHARFSASGAGEFLTRDSIAGYERWTGSMQQIMMTSMMSVRMVSDSTERVELRGGCLSPVYFVDGVAVPPDYPIWSITPDMLEGVEVYVRPHIPPEFLQGGFPCGVVALWSRKAPDLRSEVPAWRKVLIGMGVLGIGFVLILSH